MSLTPVLVKCRDGESVPAGQGVELTTSPNPGEAAAARERARVIVGREGKTLADVPNLLRGQAAAAAGPKPGPSGFTFYNVNNSAQWAAYAERDRQRRADQARQEAPERAEVVARYGSVKAVLAWTKIGEASSRGRGAMVGISPSTAPAVDREH